MLEVWDEDVMSEDDLLGRVTMHLSEISCRGSVGAQMRCIDITPEEDCPGATGKIWLKLSLPKPVNERGTDSMEKMMHLVTEESVLLEADEAIPRAPPCHGCPLLGCVARLQDFANSRGFDVVFCSCIILNAISIMVELELSGRELQADLGLDEPDSKSSANIRSIFDALNVFFACTFMVELLIRLTAFGYKFLK